MLVMNHPNYFQLLLERGAKIISPFKMRGGAERSKGRMWEASVVVKLKGYEIYLKANFHGHLTETEEVAAANLNIEKIKFYVEGGHEFILTRAKHMLIMLNDRVLANADTLEAENAEIVRKLISYNTAKYVGITSSVELSSLEAMGYGTIIKW